MDARNSQFLQRTATNSSGSLQLKSPVSLEAGDFGLYTWRCLSWWVCSAGACLGGCLRLLWRLSAWRSCGGSLPRWAVLGAPCVCPGAAWSSERLALALAPVCLAELWREFAPVGCLGSALRLPWRRLVWRVSCDCLVAAWSGERLARALVPVCWRSCGGSLPWWAALGAPCVCLGAVWSGGCPAFALALLGLASALRLPWRRLVWRMSCICLGTAWSSERLAFALAPVCLAELWREFPLAGACLGGCFLGGSLPRRCLS